MHREDRGDGGRVVDRCHEGRQSRPRADQLFGRGRTILGREVHHQTHLGVVDAGPVVQQDQLDRRCVEHPADEHQEWLVVVPDVDRTGQLATGLVEGLHTLSLLRLLLFTFGVEPAPIGQEHEDHRRDQQRDPDRTRAPDQRRKQADRQVPGGMQQVETVRKYQECRERLAVDEGDDERDEQFVQREVREHRDRCREPDHQAERRGHVEEAEDDLRDRDGHDELRDVVRDLVPKPAPQELARGDAEQHGEREHPGPREDQRGNPECVGE